MNRDELAKRSEGALDVVDAATADCGLLERLLKAPDWLVRLRAAPSLVSDEVAKEAELARAVARVDKLDASALKPLGAARKRLAKRVKARLRELEVEPSPAKLEDLLAQLLARAIALAGAAGRCPACGYRLDTESNCPRCGQTPPQS